MRVGPYFSGHLARHLRRLRFPALAVAAGLLVSAAAAGIADRAFPPDLSRYRDLSPAVLDRGGDFLRIFHARDGAIRFPAAPEAVDARYLAILTAYEDRRFAWHPGVDPLAMLRAAGQAASAGRIVSGGSTLTMQVARLLEPAPRTLAAKTGQMLRALQLERRYSKTEILSMYLTLAPFGGNLEGVRAASRAWFGKEPARLTDGEAALLVAIPQSPTRRRPDRAPETARAARDRVIDRIGPVLGWSGRRMAEAKAEPVPGERRPFPFRAPHFAEQVLDAAPVRAGAHRTSIDPSIQRLATRLVHEQAAALGARVNGAALVVERRGGDIVAYVGSGDYWDRRRDGAVDFAAARRSPGSTLKPFVYAAAMDAQLIRPDTLIADREVAYGTYRPTNFDSHFRGDVTMAEALRLSLNVPAIKTLADYGPNAFLTLLREAGSPIAAAAEGQDPGLTIAVGGLPASLVELAHLYTALGAEGVTVPLRYAEGDTRLARGRLASADAAASVVSILQEAQRPVAVKTGTSYGYRDAWAIGLTPEHVIAVWFGNPAGEPMAKFAGLTAAVPPLHRLVDSLASAPGPRTVVARARPTPPVPPAPQAPQARIDAACTNAIVYPRDGVRIPIASLEDGALPLRAKPHLGPAVWSVNANLLGAPDRRGHGAWTVDGPGQVDIALLSERCGPIHIGLWLY